VNKIAMNVPQRDVPQEDVPKMKKPEAVMARAMIDLQAFFR